MEFLDTIYVERFTAERASACVEGVKAPAILSEYKVRETSLLGAS
jgi:hypothetical protein